VSFKKTAQIFMQYFTNNLVRRLLNEKFNIFA